jgi:WD40 repeat protein
MHFHRDILLPIALGLLTGLGCNAESSVSSPSTPTDTGSSEPSSASADSAVGSPHSGNAAPSGASRAAAANPPRGNVTPAPAQPTSEQIAKWGLSEFEPLELLACADGFDDPAVQCMALRPDGKQFVLGGAKLTVWSLNDSQPTIELLANYKHDEVERPLRSLAISADGKWFAAGDQKGTVRIWTLSDQREVVAIRAHEGHLTQLAFAPDSRMLATTSYSGEVNLWQLPEGKKLNSLKMDQQEITHLLFLSDSLLAAAGSEAGIWNVESGRKETALTSKYVSGPALGMSRDRRLLAFNDADSIVQLWDVQAAKPTGLILRGAGARLIEFSRDGKWLATYSGDSTIRIWDAATGSVVQIIDADGGPTSALQWLPDNNSLLIASVDGRVRIWGTHNVAEAIGVQPVQLPAMATPDGAHKSLTPAQFRRVIDIRSFPRLPGAVPLWSDYGMCAYNAPVSQQEAEQFYRYCLAKAGWTEVALSAASQSGLLFRKADCELNVSFAPAADTTGRAGDLQISLHFAGNYDARWLPKFSPNNSKSSWDSFSSVSYRTKAELTDVEVALLKQFHDAGWTAYTRLAASSGEEPKSRSISMLQGGSVLTVSIGYPADSIEELSVQTSVSVSNKSLPIPPDAGWIEFDSSTDLQCVINTKMDLQQTAEFFDVQMAAEGWLAREAGRHFKDDKGWLPYIRGQQDIFLRLSALPGGGTRIVAGDAASSSWQLQKPASASKKTDKPGIEAADFKLPVGATAVKFEVDQKQIEFAVDGATPAELGEQFAAQMESLEWQREGAGIVSDEYVFITFSNAKAEIQLRARAAAKNSTAMISGDGLLWTKTLPTPPVRISYGTWLRRDHKDATLDQLDEFAAEMHKIPDSGKSK